MCDADKYFWVQAESLAAAALLARATGKQVYWDWYDSYGLTHGNILSTMNTALGIES